MEVGFALRPEDLRAVQTSGPHVVVLDSIPGGESSLSFPPPSAAVTISCICTDGGAPKIRQKICHCELLFGVALQPYTGPLHD